MEGRGKEKKVVPVQDAVAEYIVSIARNCIWEITLLNENNIIMEY